MFADLCTERPPPTALWELQGQGREEQSQEAELGSQVLLPLLWECCWQLLSLPACPFLLPQMSELKTPPTLTCKEDPTAPARPRMWLQSCGLVTNSSTLRAGQPGHAGCSFGSQVASGGEGCLGLSLPPEPRWGWEEAHAAGVATGQDGGADQGAVLLPGPSPCSEAALPLLGKGLCHRAGGGHEPHGNLVCGTALCLLPLSPFLKVPQRLCCIP